MADNGRGVTLKIGSSEGNFDHTAYFSNSYVTALSRPTCPECYGSSATDCSDNIGVRLFTASANGQVMPSNFGNDFDGISKQELFDMKAFLNNVIFDGFRQSYSDELSSKCWNNYVFRPHSGASDSTGSHNFFDCSCINCDTISYALCD